MELIPTITPADGSRTKFLFLYQPRFIVWNGVIQQPNVGYIPTTLINNQWQVSFIDANGNPLTPGVGDDIREAIN